MTQAAHSGATEETDIIPRNGEGVDWDRVEQEILCSRCGYNLRGLERERCPECGWEFEWEDVFFAERRPHPYLYEHHTGTDRFRRFRQTLMGALRPIKFWETMRITHLHRRGPLIGFAIRAWLIVTFNALLLAGLVTVAKRGMPAGTGSTLGLIEIVMDTFIEGIIGLVEGRDHIYRNPLWPVILTWLACAVPPVTVLGFWLFGITLRRHKVLTPHLWRVAIYPGAANLVLLSSLVVVGAVVVVFGPAVGPGWIPPATALLMMRGLSWLGVLLIGALVLHWPVSLLAGGYIYLKVPKWWVVVLTSQIIAGLVAINVIVQMTM